MDRVNRRIDFQTCRDHHDAIRNLLALFPESAPFDAKAARDLILRLRSILLRHLKLEDAFLYPALLSSENRTVRETASRYSQEMGGMSAEFVALLAEWSSEGVLEQRQAEFLDAWLPFKRRLELRMSKEDHGLYAIAEDYLTRELGA